MSETAAMNGAEWLARALAGTGMSHVFFVESTLRRTLLHLSDLGVRPILAHSEKAAAYMADGYARVAGRPGVCMAQSVGAANLAAGLQDAWLGRSPVIAFSGRKEPVVPAPQCVPGNSARAALRGGDEVFQPGRIDGRTAALVAPCLARGLGRDVAADASRFQRRAGRCHRARPDARVDDARDRGAGDAGAPPGGRCARHRARGGAPDRRAPGRDRRWRRCRRVQGRPGSPRLGGGVGGTGGDDPRGTWPHSDDPSPLGRGRWQLFGAAGQPHRAQRRPGAVHRLRYRRPSHAELADSADQHTDRADRGRSARNRAQLPEHDGTGRRSEGDRGAPGGTSSAARRATTASPRKPPGSSPIGAPAWRRSSRRIRRRSPSSGSAPR